MLFSDQRYSGIGKLQDPAQNKKH